MEKIKIWAVVFRTSGELWHWDYLFQSKEEAVEFLSSCREEEPNYEYKVFECEEIIDGIQQT